MSNVKDVIFRCPHCGKETNAYAEIDPFGSHSGTADIENINGEIVIDWGSLDADIEFLYKCSECGEVVAGGLEELQEMISYYEHDRHE